MAEPTNQNNTDNSNTMPAEKVNESASLLDNNTTVASTSSDVNAAATNVVIPTPAPTPSEPTSTAINSDTASTAAVITTTFLGRGQAPATPDTTTPSSPSVPSSVLAMVNSINSKNNQVVMSPMGFLASPVGNNNNNNNTINLTHTAANTVGEVMEGGGQGKVPSSVTTNTNGIVSNIRNHYMNPIRLSDNKDIRNKEEWMESGTVRSVASSRYEQIFESIVKDDDDDDDDDEIKLVETCPTNDTKEDFNDNKNGHGVIVTDEKSSSNNTSDASTLSSRRRAASRPWWLIVLALLVVAFAAIVAVIVALGMVDKDNNNNNASNNASNNVVTDPSATSTTTTITNGEILSATTDVPTAGPTMNPTTQGPTVAPTQTPSFRPTTTRAPSVAPSTDTPSSGPTFGPTEMPSSAPTNGPTDRPSMNPTAMASDGPSQAPTSAAPTISAAPTRGTLMILVSLLSGEDNDNDAAAPFAALMDMTTPQGRAVEWMTEDSMTLEWLEATSVVEVVPVVPMTDFGDLNETSTIVSLVPPTPAATLAPMDDDLEDNMGDIQAKIQQRFAVITLELSLHDSAPSTTTTTTAASRSGGGLVWNFPRNVHECEWPGIECNDFYDDWRITSINWARQELNGYVAPELSLLTSLAHLDLAQNNLTGFVDVFWTVPSLETLYLHDNQFMGPLGENDAIGQMSNLQHLYLGSNKLTGSIPESLWKDINLRYLILNNNQLTGTLPSRIRNNNLYYLGISHNQLTGELPEDLIFPSIRHLYLDHNQFSGSIPQDYANLGSQRILQFFVNDNMLTGRFPGEWHRNLPHKFLTNVDISNNRLKGNLPSNVCMLSVYDEGETIEFRADCDVCSCGRFCYRWCDRK